MLKFNNRHSEYENLYLKWEGIQYDRKKLKSFIRRYNFVYILSFIFKSYRKELEILKKVIDHYGRSRILQLTTNNEYASRLSHIERLSRIGSSEILTKGSYKPETYRVISNLPKRDYDLVTKRTQELIKIGQSVCTQDDELSKSLPSD